MTAFKLIEAFSQAKTLDKKLSVAKEPTEQHINELTNEQYQFYLLFISLDKRPSR